MKSLIIYFFFLIGFTAYSQGFRTHYFSQAAFDNRTQSIFELPNGTYFGGGVVLETVNGRTRFSLQLVGLNSSGNVIWQKKYAHPTLDYGSTPLVYKGFYKVDNNVYFAGVATGTALPQNGVLFKFDFNGDTVWRKILTDPTEDILPQIITKSVDGGLLVTGWFQNWTTGARPCLILKTDANGNELWRKRIHKTIIDVSDGKAIIQDSATKKIVIVGSQYIGPNSNSYSNKHNILILDSLGNKISQTSYPVDGTLQDLIQTKDKYFVAVGGIAGNKGYSYMIKFDVNNPSQPIWRIDNFGPYIVRNSFSALTELPNGDIMTAGVVDTVGMYDLNYLIANIRLSRFTTTGALVKTKFYDYRLSKTNTNLIIMTSLKNTSDGGLVGAVWANNFNVVNPFLFVKFDDNGCDTTLTACSNLVDVNELNSDESNFKVYPNPANDILNISFSMSSESNQYNLKIADMIGKIQMTEKFSYSNQSQHQLKISALEKGIYFLEVWQDDKLIGIEKIIKD